MPAAVLGIKSLGQPIAGAMLTVGIKVLFGAGSVGLEPIPWDIDKLAISPQDTSNKVERLKKNVVRNGLSQKKICLMFKIINPFYSLPINTKTIRMITTRPKPPLGP